MTDVEKAGIVTLIEARSDLIAVGMPAASMRVNKLIDKHLSNIGYDGRDEFIEYAQKIWETIRPE